MATGNTFCNDLLKLIFNATAIANIADNAASSPNTNLYIALHTANPVAGDQTTSEATYTGYARVAVVRTTSGWTAASAQVTSNVAAINFALCTAGSNTITYASIGKTTSGASEIYFSGALTSSLAVSNGITPSFAIGALSVTES